MISNEIVIYIKSELANGKNRQEITDSLVGAGWDVSSVRESFDLISVPIPTSSINLPPQVPNGSVTEKNYPIAKIWIFKAPILLIIISIILLFVGYWIPYFVLAIPILLISNPLIRANFHYAIREDYFEIKQGVFSKKQRNVPYGVIQNVFVNQDLFDKVFGIASFRIENASQGQKKGFWGQTRNNQIGLSNVSKQINAIGSQDNKVFIPGLKKKDAEQLKAVILQRMKEHPLEDNQSGL